MTKKAQIWDNHEEFGALVQKEREKRGWSQEKLGQEAGIATSSVFSMEHGKPTIVRTRVWVAGVLGIELA